MTVPKAEEDSVGKYAIEDSNAPPKQSSKAAPEALQSSQTLDRIMCADLGGICIPMRGDQEQDGGETGGFVTVEIARLKIPPEDQRVFEFEVSSKKPEHLFIVMRDCAGGAYLMAIDFNYIKWLRIASGCSRLTRIAPVRYDIRPLDLVDLDRATDTRKERLHPTRGALWDCHYQKPLGA